MGVHSAMATGDIRVIDLWCVIGHVHSPRPNDASYHTARGLKLLQVGILSFVYCCCTSLVSLMPKAANCRPVPPPVGLEPCRCYDDLPGPCLEMFFCLGPTLSGDPVLLAKVVRVAKGVLKDCTSSPGAGLDSAVSDNNNQELT